MKQKKITAFLFSSLLILSGLFPVGISSKASQSEHVTKAQELSCNLDQSFATARVWAEKAKKNIFKKVLDNGLTVLFYPKTDVPDVRIEIVYRIGSKDEKTEKTYGFSHLVEHMTFKGTTDEGLGLSESDIAAIGERVGLGSVAGSHNVNAYTSYDSTCYFFDANTTNWPIFINIFADWMKNLRFDPQHLNSEVKAVYQEIKWRADRSDSFYTMLTEVFPHDHPYHNSVIGYKENILKATSDDLRDYYQKYYTPENAALIVVGNVDKDQLFSYVEKCFGSIPSKSSSTKACTQVGALPFRADFSQKNIDVYQEIPKPYITYLWRIPGIADKDSVNVKCLSFVLSDRLARKLYDEKKIVYNIGVGPLLLQFAGVFEIGFMPKEKSDNSTNVTEECKNIIINELNDIITHGIKDDELQRFKKIVLTGFLRSFEYCGAFSNSLRQCFLEGKQDDIGAYIDESFEDIKNITVETTREFARRYLRPFLMNAVCVIPVPEGEKENWLELRKQIDEYDHALLSQRQRTTEIEPPRFALKVKKPAPLDFSFDYPDGQFTLSNGLQVYFKKKTTVPFVSVRCTFKKADERDLLYAMKKEMLIPYFAMSQLIEGSEGFTKKEHEEFFDTYGASWSFGSAGGGFSCVTSDIEDIAKRFVHILTKPTFPKDVFEKKISDSIDGIIMNQKIPGAQCSNMLNQYLFKQYPWIMSDEKTIAELRSYTLDDLRTFHKENVQPSSMFITVVGDVEQDNLKQILEKIFGLLKHTHENEQAAVVVPDINNPRAISLQKFLPEDQMLVSAARVTTYKDDDEFLCLQLLETSLRNYLFMIRERSGLFYGCGASLATCWASKTKGYAHIITEVALSNVQHAEQALRYVLKSIADNGITQQALDETKQLYQNEFAKSFVTNSAIVNAYSDLISNEKEFDYYEKRLSRLKAITLEQVNEVAKKYLDPETWTWCKVGRVEQSQEAAEA
jgi:zinc protease